MQNLSYMSYQLTPPVFLEKKFISHVQSYSQTTRHMLLHPDFGTFTNGTFIEGHYTSTLYQFRNLYRVLYRYGFRRLCGYCERQSNDLSTESSKDLKFMMRIQKMKAKYYEEPALLMESIRTEIFDT